MCCTKGLTCGLFWPLPGADCDRVIREIEEIIGLDCSNILKVSAKMGVGIEETLEAIVNLIPPPKNNLDKPLRALIFDSYYDAYRGVVCQFRVTDGCVSKGDVVRMMNTGKEYQLDEVGVLAPHKIEVGFEERGGAARNPVLDDIPVPGRHAVLRRGRVPGGSDQIRQGRTSRRHGHSEGLACRRAPGRVRRCAANGLLRALPN